MVGGSVKVSGVVVVKNARFKGAQETRKNLFLGDDDIIEEVTNVPQFLLAWNVPLNVHALMNTERTLKSQKFKVDISIRCYLQQVTGTTTGNSNTTPTKTTPFP